MQGTIQRRTPKNNTEHYYMIFFLIFEDIRLTFFQAKIASVDQQFSIDFYLLNTTAIHIFIFIFAVILLGKTPWLFLHIP